MQGMGKDIASKYQASVGMMDWSKTSAYLQSNKMYNASYVGESEDAEQINGDDPFGESAGAFRQQAGTVSTKPTEGKEGNRHGASGSQSTRLALQANPKSASCDEYSGQEWTTDRNHSRWRMVH